MIKLLSLLLFLCIQATYGLDCATMSKDEEFESADIVFFGRVIDVNDTSYRIRVLESYKGNLGDTLIGIIGENLKPKNKSYWLIYGMTNDSKLFSILECSGSKSQVHHVGWNDVSIPYPAPTIFNNNRPLTEIYDEIQNNKSLNEFYFEIASLREKVRKSELQIITVKLNQLIESNVEDRTSMKRMNLVIYGLTAVTLLLLTFQLKRRKIP